MAPSASERLTATWLGTATIDLCCRSEHILIDPYKQWGKPQQRAAVEQALQRASAVLITHPHMDHFADVADMVCLCPGPIYVLERGVEIAARRHVDTSRLRVIRPGDDLNIGPFMVHVWQGKHVVFDKPLLKTTIRRVFKPSNFMTGLRLGILNRRFSIGENDICSFAITCAGRQLFVMGSASMRPDVDYPQGMDCLFFPYQGRSELAQYSRPMIDRLAPRRIILTHFDDAFPPISQRIDTLPLQKLYPIAEEAVWGKEIGL